MIKDMVIASFLQIWHIIPIAVAIVLFRKFMSMNDKKRRIKKNEENEKNGLTLELRTKRKYEELGYKVINHNAEGIDLLMHKDNKTILFRCKDSYESKSIKDEDIKTFHNNANKYVKSTDINNAEFRYIIPYSDVLHKSAIKILKDDSYNCKYVVV